MKMTKKAQAALLRILNANDKRPIYSRAWLTDGGRWAATDGFRLVRLYDAPPADIPQTAERGGRFDADATIRRAEEEARQIYTHNTRGTVPMELPTRAELAAWIRDHGGRRAARAATIAIGGGAVLVNPVFLLDLLEILGDDARALVPGGPLKPVLLWSDVGDAMLLPIRPDPEMHGKEAGKVVYYWNSRGGEVIA